MKSSPVATSGAAERQFFFFNYASGYDLFGKSGAETPSDSQNNKKSREIERITACDYPQLSSFHAARMQIYERSRLNMKKRLSILWPLRLLFTAGHPETLIFMPWRQRPSLITDVRRLKSRIIARRTPFAPQPQFS